MLLCIAGGRSAPPKNEVAGIAGYITVSTMNRIFKKRAYGRKIRLTDRINALDWHTSHVPVACEIFKYSQSTVERHWRCCIRDE